MRLVGLLVLTVLALAACAPRAVSVPLSPDEPGTGSSLVMLMPVEGVRVATVDNNFGASRGGRWHEGVDIFAPRGTPVRPAAAGVVWHTGNTGLGGLSVAIDGDDGMRYFYTHLDSIAAGIRDGQRVSLQQIIGRVGNTGNASGGPPHLHFAVYAPTSDGAAWMAFDPMPHLRDRSLGG